MLLIAIGEGRCDPAPFILLSPSVKRVVELQNPAEGRREKRKWGQGDLFLPQFREAEGGCVIVSEKTESLMWRQGLVEGSAITTGSVEEPLCKQPVLLGRNEPSLLPLICPAPQHVSSPDITPHIYAEVGINPKC